MGLWNTHGMIKDEDDQMDACADLGLLPEELDHLAKRARDEAAAFDYLRANSSGQQKRKCGLVARYWRLRGQQLKRLAALVEQDLTE